MFGSGGRKSWGIGQVPGEGQFQGDLQDISSSFNMALFDCGHFEKKDILDCYVALIFSNKGEEEKEVVSAGKSCWWKGPSSSHMEAGLRRRGLRSKERMRGVREVNVW